MSRVLEDAPLEKLLTHAGIGSWDRYTWFRGCRLHKTTIMVPHPKLAASIERLFLPKLAGYRVVVERRAKGPMKPSQGHVEPTAQRLLDNEPE